MKSDMEIPTQQQIPLRWTAVLGQFSEVPWALRILLLLALIVPFGFAGWFAWQEYTASLEEVHARAERSAVALAEHVDSVLEVHALVLRQVANLTAGMTWNEIAEDKRLQHALSDLAANFGQISVIGIADAQGRVWFHSTGPVSDTYSVKDRDFFLAHRSGGADRMHFGQVFTGPLSGRRQFAVSIARDNPSGAFDGVIYTAVSIDYLVDFWKQFIPSEGYLIPMIRDDGTLIVRYPTLDNLERLDPNGPFVRHVKSSPKGIYTAVSHVDGIERINAYSQIGHYPLYISYSVEKSVAMEKWQHDTVVVLAVAAAIAAALTTLLIFAIRQSRGQALAIARWRDVADDLNREVTRRKEAEATLLHAQKLDALGQLTGGIAHDFNNLLAGISGNLELMRFRLGSSNEGVMRHIDAAEHVVDKATAITRHLLAFSRRQALSPTPTNVNDRIALMLEFIARTIGPGIELRTDLASGAVITLCDESQLDSALLNLVINARDAMPLGGRLTISTSRTDTERTVGATTAQVPSGKYVTITVADTGTGMSDEIRERAFDPFFTTKPIGQGTGLGLSMVYGFIKQSGGEIRIDSKVNVGTHVRLYLPLFEGRPEAGVPHPAVKFESRPAIKATVVLVDDEAALRSVLADVLTDMGCKVISEEDAMRALTVFDSTEQVDILITDVGLPGNMNGKALAAAAKLRRPNLKVMFITGYHDQTITEVYLKELGAELMTKPFKMDAFLQKVTEMAR